MVQEQRLHSSPLAQPFGTHGMKDVIHVVVDRCMLRWLYVVVQRSCQNLNASFLVVLPDIALGIDAVRQSRPIETARSVAERSDRERGCLDCL